MNMHTEQRRRFLEALTTRGAAAVIPTATHKVRNHDCEYRFRPDSDFWYLTGFSEPDAVLVLVPPLATTNSKVPRSILFLREKDKDREIWTGKRLGVAAAAAALGVDEARPIERLWTDLPEILRNVEKIVWRTGVDEARDRELFAVVAKLRATAKGGIVPPLELLDPSPLLHELRLKKSTSELDVMRRAARITKDAHIAAMKRARPGVNEREIDALLDMTFRASGASGAAYTNIVAGGANACCLHYVENDDVLKDGDLLLIDAGSEFEYYASDVTRTFPINGRFNAEQRALYEVVLDAQLTAIAHVKTGVTFVSVHEIALQRLVFGLVRLGLLTGPVDAAIEKKTYDRFYMHRTSHWLGLDVHDCGAYVVDGKSRTLEPGMVITVEPGVYVAEDDTTVEARWRGIGIRIEDDVLVTTTGHEVLTAGIPKHIDEVEATCGSKSLSSVHG
ncbi:MAG: aminopeptidase P N-terminal domain-containing protein [Planctomycetota bacterium]|nr:aminopeptidase P N-terminal domain-containing protein [Planctomycetota bacterium]